MSINYRQREVALPISEELAGHFFEGREETLDLDVIGEDILRLAEEGGFDYDLFNDIILRLQIDILNEFKSSRDTSKVRFGLAENCIDVLEVLPEEEVRIAVLFGRWDALGPRMCMKWLKARPTKKQRFALDRFLYYLGAYDRAFTGNDTINVRMKRATRKNKELRNVKEGLLSSPLPENVIRSMILPMLQNKGNKAAPLAPLVKNEKSTCPSCFTRCKRGTHRTRRNH